MPLDITIIIGLVGSIASVVALFISGSGWRAKAVHVLYGLAITALAVGLTYYQGQVTDLTRIEVQARKLADSRRIVQPGTGAYYKGSDRGFILAALTFIEKNKVKFPDTYTRAKTFSESAGVLTQNVTGFSTDQEIRDKNLSDGADAMEALLRGIASGGIN